MAFNLQSKIDAIRNEAQTRVREINWEIRKLTKERDDILSFIGSGSSSSSSRPPPHGTKMQTIVERFETDRAREWPILFKIFLGTEPGRSRLCQNSSWANEFVA